MDVRLNSTLRQLTGQRVYQLQLGSNADVAHALARLAAAAPPLAEKLWDVEGRLSDQIVLFLNGRNILFAHGLETPVAATDVLDLFPKTGAQRAFAALDATPPEIAG